MKNTLLGSLILVTCAPLLGARQEPVSPTPAPELKSFEPFVGAWKGSGKLWMEPASEPTPWTATAQASWILNGHAVQHDEQIDTEMGPILFRSLYGWDREAREPVCYSISNMGPGSTEVRWIDEKTLVGVAHGIQEGVPVADRWTTTFKGNGYAFTMDRAVGSGPFFRHVEGTFQRIEGEPAAPAEASAATASPGEAMRRLEPLVGTYELKGKVLLPEGEMEVTGHEENQWLFGGAAVGGHVDGQPGNYAADWYVSFDESAGVYRHVYATSMGEIGMHEARFEGGDLVFTSASPMHGQASASRTILYISNGAVTRAVSHSLLGTSEPQVSFEATYERAGGAGGGEAKTAGFTPGSCCAVASAAGKSCTHPCCVAATERGEVCEKCN